MNLHSPTSAILSAVIFNALIIPALIPVALKGVKYRVMGADDLLKETSSTGDSAASYCRSSASS
jgi:high-affinity K+ transport system ATPase subunit B